MAVKTYRIAFQVETDGKPNVLCDCGDMVMLADYIELFDLVETLANDLADSNEKPGPKTEAALRKFQKAIVELAASHAEEPAESTPKSELN
jgi:hypothetical protein